ncbi:hypothetical protein [Enterovirga sp. CN4-39]|uniref:hypothetical protein n=1 Tax=Enterovirga sp. CN4-39 TaxID=3400910 RepID=UPI003C0C7DD0
MSSRPHKALARTTPSRSARGVVRVEVEVRLEDAPLIRMVARALRDPGRAPTARAMLDRRLARTEAAGLKELLASAPLDGIELDRSQDTGRIVDL